MTLQEIFKTNPALMEEPEVKALIQYSALGIKRLKESRDKVMQDYEKTLEICINSEAFVFCGVTYEETVHAILKLHNVE